MKFMLVEIPLVRFAFILALTPLLFISVWQQGVVAQENADGDGTIANMLEQTVTRTSSRNNRPLNAEDTRITFRHSVGEINQILVSGVQYSQSVTYRIDSIGETSFCFSEGSQTQENNGASSLCTMFTNIAALNYINSIGIAPFSASDPGGFGSAINRSLEQYRDGSTSEVRIAGLYVRFLSAITVTNPIDSILTGINFFAPGNIQSNVFISSIWDDYFCLGYVRGTDGIGFQTNDCIPYTNVAFLRFFYLSEIPDYPQTFPSLEDFETQSFGGVLPAIEVRDPVDPIMLSEMLNALLQEEDTLPIRLALNVPINATTPIVEIGSANSVGETAFTLSRVGTDYFCITKHDPARSNTAVREQCITFANVAEIEGTMVEAMP